MAWENATKWVEGTNCISFWRTTGMLSSGVWPPDSRFITMNTGKASRPNCGMERTRVASMMPSAVTENR